MNDIAMARSEDPADLVLKALGAGVWDYDIDTDRLSCSPRWYEILGLEEKDTPIRRVDDFKPYIHPDDVRMATEIDLDMVEMLIEGDARYHNEFRIVRPTGEVHLVRSVACIVMDASTGHRRAVGCITDLADLGALEDGLAKRHMRRARRVEASALDQSIQPPKSEDAEKGLSNRERECLRWVSVGKTALETGIILGTSKRTIEYHIRNAVIKLGATNKIHATVLAMRDGLL